ncbi:NAD(+) diphosphatase [Allokutzneria sp. A3M-2-11 16]|uniref:NAD(+) diphosphatase n=1 Tax=Allokutzneria sp. A3M-2-11 16 TaxID=2962043 RepID=UPI0020B87192|nr:NAD(+) diphosphatase [Allokutzneria sp. A3M-2-11 16]MCP3798527.1 NAD(+) diphosphatase [Allokutzneria sp. A3M-2-11 16]
MTDFALDGLPALSRSTVDRADALRDNAELLSKGWKEATLVVIDERGRTRLADDVLHLGSTGDLSDAPVEGAVFLGVQDETAYWAVRGPGAEDWQDLRMCGALLSDTDAGLMTAAVGLLAWHDLSNFCARCGSPTKAIRAGWARQCTGCAHEEYPRTDPAVICLVHDGDSHVLLARQPVWPAERYSVLAGFVEVGESLEACVEREVGEEVGVAVRAVRYLGSQPWPFPRSLMVGFSALADRDAPLVLAEGEIEHAKWVHRDEVRAAFAAGGAVPGLGLPGASSIAHKMLAAWANVVL